MRHSSFTIWFTDGTELEESAFIMRDAVILALAKRIADGKNDSIKSIQNEEGDHYEIAENMKFKIIE